MRGRAGETEGFIPHLEYHGCDGSARSYCLLWLVLGFCASHLISKIWCIGGTSMPNSWYFIFSWLSNCEHFLSSVHIIPISAYIHFKNLDEGDFRKDECPSWLGWWCSGSLLPSAEISNDLSQMLRPLPKQCRVLHTAGIDSFTFSCSKFSCRLKKRLQGHLTIEQSCNWPYSNQACLVYSDRARKSVKIPLAFIGHVRTVDNYSVGP